MNAKSKLSGSVSLAGCAAVTAALLSCAAPIEKAYAQPLRDSLGAYEVQVLVDGTEAPRFFHAGESYVLGQMGQRYTLRVWNRSHRRVEAVVSVDGRDVIDGRPGDFRNKRGYLVPAGGFVDIDGWRVSDRQAAAFRFTTVSDSYAGRMGSARNVGVIGVAVFPERIHFSHRPQPIAPQDRYGERSDDRPRHKSARTRPPPPPVGPRPPSGAREPAMARSERHPQRPGLGSSTGNATTPHPGGRFVRDSNRPAHLGPPLHDRPCLKPGVSTDGHYAPDSKDPGTANPSPPPAPTPSPPTALTPVPEPSPSPYCTRPGFSFPLTSTPTDPASARIRLLYDTPDHLPS